jgi:hypothetical protein
MKQYVGWMIGLCFWGSVAIAQSTPLQIKCTPPKNVKLGSALSLKVEIQHQIKEEKTGQLTFSILNASNQQSTDGWFLNFFPFQYFTTIANENFSTTFPFTVPHDYKGKFIIELVAKVGNIKDSVRYTINTTNK